MAQVPDVSLLWRTPAEVGELSTETIIFRDDVGNKVSPSPLIIGSATFVGFTLAWRLALRSVASSLVPIIFVLDCIRQSPPR